MEALLLLAAIALGIVGVEHLSKQPASSAPPAASGGGSPAPGSSGGSASGGGIGGVGPPAPVPAALPGVYPPGTPGTYPITISAAGGDGFGRVTVIPGNGKVLDGDSQTFHFGPGTWVTLEAHVDGGLAAFGTAFDHWSGPGVTSRDNPLVVKITGGGFVRASYATFGIVG